MMWISAALRASSTLHSVNGVVFVFSRQPPTEQLWLATPGGGFHYVWHDQGSAWRDTKTDASFHEFSGCGAEDTHRATAIVAW